MNIMHEGEAVEDKPTVVRRSQLPRFNSRRFSSVSSNDGNGNDHDNGNGNDNGSVQHTEQERLTARPHLDPRAILPQGARAMDNALATTLESALGSSPLPTMDVRFRDLTITATVTIPPSVSSDAPHTTTLLTPVKKLLNRLLSRHCVVEKPILRGLTGAFHPGRLTLLLGQVGSGKTSLMKTLSGRFHTGRHTTVSGDITYSGLSRKELWPLLPRYVTYADATDAHFATMTVEETLEFAYICSSGKGLPSWMYNAVGNLPVPEEHRRFALDTIHILQEHAVELVSKRIGLDDQMETLVGDRMMPDVGLPPSGRKRVTVGELGFGYKRVHILDEVNAGLDTAASLEIVDAFKSMATSFNRTVVASLQHITPEVFSLFDDLLLLHDGYMLYQGPRDEVLPYFESLGYKCPERKDVSDFLIELGTKKQDLYRMKTVSQPIPRTGAEFADCFRRSSHFERVQAYMETSPPSADRMPVLLEIPPFELRYWDELLQLIRRHWLLTTRSKAFYLARTLVVFLFGVLYGTSFWQLDDTTPQLMIGLFFSFSMFLSVGHALQIPVFFGRRAVFYKQRGANFYRTSSYVIASCFAHLVFAAFETLLFGMFIYWMGGFVPLTDRFFVFLITVFLLQIFFTSFFFLLASAVPTPALAQPILVPTLITFILFSGFLITKENLPSYLSWFYWLDPLAWTIRALAVNQYTAPRYKTCTYNGIQYCDQTGGYTMSQSTLATYDITDDANWVYYMWILFVVSSFLLLFVAYLFLEYRRYETPTPIHIDLQTVAREMEVESDAEVALSSSDKQTPSSEPYDVYFLQEDTPRNSNKAEESKGYGVSTKPSELSYDVAAEEDAFTIPVTGTSGFVPVTLAFQDLWYTVPRPRISSQSAGDGESELEEVDLLCGISGFALPGTMTALVGSAAAGTTTLLNVIAGRAPPPSMGGGVVRGGVFLNGYPATKLVMQRCSVYGHHLDIHDDSATIREAMVFSAMLRQDAAIPTSAKLESVEECIELLELRPIANKMIRGLSPAQLKRITIGVELASSPSVVFMDSPANGLDTLSAQVVMNGLRKVADKGRTVICTLREPSACVFDLFDSALVLQRGGKIAFFGETGDNSSKVIEYFQQVPGVPPLQPGHNPVSWILDCIGDDLEHSAHPCQHHEPQTPVVERRRSRQLSGADTSHNHSAQLNRSISSLLAPPPIIVDMAVHFKESELARILSEDMAQDGVTWPSLCLPIISYGNKRAAPWSTQFALLVMRFSRAHWRMPVYNLTRFMLNIVLALLFGVMFYGTDFTTYRGANAAVGLMYLSTIILGLISFNSVVPVIAANRAVFNRERSTETYNALWYHLAVMLVELPYAFFTALLFTSIVFPMVGFSGRSNFLTFWLIMSLHSLVQVYLAHLLVYLLRSVPAAMFHGVTLKTLYLIFAGFNPPASKILVEYKWLHYACPPTYSLAALVATVLTDCSTPGGPEPACQPLTGTPVGLNGLTLKEYIEDNFEMRHDEIWRNIGIVIGIIVLLRVLGLIIMRFGNRN